MRYLIHLLALIGGILSTALFAYIGIGFSDEYTVFQLLVASQASVLAIVVSVSLLSLQLSANQFTPLVIRTLQKNNFLRLFISLFGISILLDLLLMVGVPFESTLSAYAPGNFDLGIAAGFATLCFLSLFIVRRNTIELVEPETVLEALVEDIDTSDIPSRGSRDYETPPQRHPLLEIFQVMESAERRNDEYTVLRSLHALREATTNLLLDYSRSESSGLDEELLFDYWERSIEIGVDGGIDRLEIIVHAQKRASIILIQDGYSNLANQPIKLLYESITAAFSNRIWESDLLNPYVTVVDTALSCESSEPIRTIVEYHGRLISDIAVEVEGMTGEQQDVIEKTIENIAQIWSKTLHTENLDPQSRLRLGERCEQNLTRGISEFSSEDQPTNPLIEDVYDNVQLVAESAASAEDRISLKNLIGLLVELELARGRSSQDFVNTLNEISADGELIYEEYTEIKGQIQSDNYQSSFQSLSGIEGHDTVDEWLDEVGQEMN